MFLILNYKSTMNTDFFPLCNITPLFCTASLCFFVKLCTQCPQTTMAVRLLNGKRVLVMGNRGYSYSVPSWKRTHAIDHVPPYDYAPILSKAFFVLQRFPPPQSQKRERKFNANSKFRGKCHLRVRKKGRRLHGLLTTLWQGPLQQLARQRKKGNGLIERSTRPQGH